MLAHLNNKFSQSETDLITLSISIDEIKIALPSVNKGNFWNITAFHTKYKIHKFINKAYMRFFL